MVQHTSWVYWESYRKQCKVKCLCVRTSVVSLPDKIKRHGYRKGETVSFRPVDKGLGRQRVRQRGEPGGLRPPISSAPLSQPWGAERQPSFLPLPRVPGKPHLREKPSHANQSLLSFVLKPNNKSQSYLVEDHSFPCAAGSPPPPPPASHYSPWRVQLTPAPSLTPAF